MTRVPEWSGSLRVTGSRAAHPRPRSPHTGTLHPMPTDNERDEEAQYQLTQLWWLVKAIIVASIAIALWQAIT